MDISAENVAICHKAGLSFVYQMDVVQLEKHDPTVTLEVILLMDVLEHIPKDQTVSLLAQVRGRLTRGGWVVIQTPNMGCVFGHYHRFNDLTHEFGLTEKTAIDLMVAAGFERVDVQVRPAWNATTFLGRIREQYLKVLHRVVYLAEDSSRPRIPTKNLLIRGIKR